MSPHMGWSSLWSRRGVALVLAAVLLLPLVAGCGMPRRVRSMFGGELPIEVKVSPQVNHDTPVAVELVIAYDDKALDELLKVSKDTWFRNRGQLLRDYGGRVESWKWEWVPGQEVSPWAISYRIGAKGAVLYADYLTPGEHRARIDPHHPLRLVLGDMDFALAEPR
jgi:type VI secretion system protein